MSAAVLELKERIENLSSEEWRELEPVIWDKQIEEDAASGRLDFLFSEIDQAEAAGEIKDWPEDKP